MLWDLFCRVVDNFGDIGVCWRVATDLASRGERVRLWVDDASALAWMAPQGRPGVEVITWDAGCTDSATPGDVVIEAFGCHLPDAFVTRMAQAERAPVWINLEYLSAESYVERSHRLPSPQSGPGAGLTKWFFYPGFTAATGGLPRERDLLGRQMRFEPVRWLAGHGLKRGPDERIVSLFCYDNPALDGLLDELANSPTLLLATTGLASSQVERLLGPGMRRGALRAVVIPRLAQVDYDHLLWASDLNFVRGEDSFVRAQWAAKPFVWHIYPQDDGAHANKLVAFENLFLQGAEPPLADAVRRLHAAWNGLAPGPLVFPPRAAWQAWEEHAESWRDGLLGQPDLVGQLFDFAVERR